MRHAMAPELLSGWKKAQTHMNDIFDLIHLYPSYTTTQSGFLNGGILILAVMSALLGLVSISESDDLTGM